MGYRSEVRIATTREGYDLMCDKVDSVSAGRTSYPLMGSDRQPEFFDEESGTVVFGWDSIKWYEGLLSDVTNVVERAGMTSSSGHPARTRSSLSTSNPLSPSTSSERKCLFRSTGTIGAVILNCRFDKKHAFSGTNPLVCFEASQIISY